jgi:hypothetical protein
MFSPRIENILSTIIKKIEGDMKYLYALMDDETRFWIAQQVADTKYTDNINPLFHKGKELTGKRPNTLIRDGATNFNDSIIILCIKGQGWNVFVSSNCYCWSNN